MAGTRQARGKGQPDQEIHNLFATLNQEQEREKHDLSGIYEGRLRSHAQNFEGLKRKWEGFTGVPLPKRLRTSEPDIIAPVEKENAAPNQQPIAEDELNQKPPAAAKTVKKQKANAAAKVTVNAAVPAPAMPPHPDDKININSMIVNDLRKELRKRHLSTSGRKAELQARLREHLTEAKQNREAQWAKKHAAVVKKEAAAEPRIKQVKISNTTNGKNCGGTSKEDVKEMDVEMEDANDVDVSMRNDSDKPAAKKAQASKPPTNNNYPSAAMKKQAPKSALKPSKYTASSTVQSTPQLDDAKPILSSLAKEDLPAPKQLIPSKVSDTSTDSAGVVADPITKSSKLQPSVQKNKISSTLAQTTPIGSAFKTKVGGAGSAKLLAKKNAHSAASEARKARLAEMRQKAKPTAASASSATKPPSSHSKYASLKKMASASKVGENKPNSILAKMREKAAAEKNTENAVSAPPTKSSINAKSVSQVVPSSQPAMKSSPRALKSILDPANRLPAVSEPIKSESPKPVEKPLSPMQTYEMSDREESSDSESESDEEDERQRPKKSIPEWALKANLHRALERQFADGPNLLDPDKIFGEVITCNLEAIFDKKKSRYQRRTSSGNWTKDHVTLAEKLTYKRTMGYDK